MRRRGPFLTVCLGLMASVAGCGSTTDAALPDPIVVPLLVETYTDGATRLFIQVQLGGAPPFTALLDTGSSGLRVIDTAVPRTAFTTVTDTPVSYAYGNYDSSISINGVVAYAPLTLGALTTERPIAIMYVETGGCSGTGTNCRTLQDQFSEAPAILGVGMRTASNAQGIGNPIAQMPGRPPFVIHIPTGFSSMDGTLRIGRATTDALAFQTLKLPSLGQGVPLPNGAPSWNDAAIPCCVDNDLTGESFCYPSLWDTGAPVSTITTAGQPLALTTELAVGSPIRVTIGPESAPVGAYEFVVGAMPQPGIDEVLIEPAAGSPGINLGVALFNQFDVLFDQARGVVGLAAR